MVFLAQVSGQWTAGLQRQLHSMQQDIAKLKERQKEMSAGPSQHEMMMVIQQQQWQIQQLTHSVNQCYQALLAIQREISHLTILSVER